MGNKKILILTGSYNNGHKTASRNIAIYCEKNGFPYLEIDYYDYIYPLLSSFFKKTFSKIQTINSIQELIFNFMNTELCNKILELYGSMISNESMEKDIYKFDPDIIVITYARWKYHLHHFMDFIKKSMIIGTFITDCGDVSNLWFDPMNNFYFCIDRYTFLFISNKILVNQKSIISFFPVDKKRYQYKSYIGKNNFVLLLSNLDDDFCKHFLLNWKDNKKLNVVKGSNDELFYKLKEEFSGKKMIIRYESLDFVSIANEIDIMIAKPGGALMSECIVSCIPLLIPCYSMGIEEGNMKFIQYEGLGIYETDPIKMLKYIECKNFNEMLPSFHKYQNYDAAKIIIDSLISLYEENR